MSAANQSARRRFYIEPLDDRFLLSGFGVPVQSEAPAVLDAGAVDRSDRILVVELFPADAENDAGEEMVVSTLPQHIVSAVSDRFPGARLTAGEVDVEDGGLFFGVSAEVNGLELEIKLAQDGSVIEIERTLEPAQLPQAVHGWIFSNFPGASVEEAALLDSLSYELLIVTSAHEAFEATLRVADGKATHDLPALTESTGAFAASLDVPGAARSAWADARDETSPRSPGIASTLARAAPPGRSAPGEGAATERVSLERAHLGAARAGTESGGEPPEASSIANSSGNAWSAGTVGADLVRGIFHQPGFLPAVLRPTVSTLVESIPGWFPQIGMALSEVLPLEMGAIEHGLERFLDEIDALAERIAPAGQASALTPRLFIAAAALWGAERVISDMRKARRDPVLAGEGETLSWTWALQLGACHDA